MVNEKPGSKPIPLATGGVAMTTTREERVTEKREVFAMKVSVEVGCTPFIDVERLLEEVAAASGMPVTAFSLSRETEDSLASARSQCEREGTPAQQRLRSRHLLSLTYTILVDTSLVSGTALTTPELAAKMSQSIVSAASQLNATVLDARLAGRSPICLLVILRTADY